MAAAAAVMMTVPWSSLVPVDLHSFAFALRLVRNTVTVASPLTDGLDVAHDALERAAGSWYTQLDRHPDAAAMEARGAFDELCDVLSLSDCTCADAALDRRVLRAAVSDAAGALMEFVAVRSGPPVPWEVGPDAVTLGHLMVAGSALSTVIAALDE
ncbi:hypothetical protein [Rhodococcus sp. SORGH_AS_0301]|uniref:hypothetical protein n=1 Tax=Rhodococcus sp. SORGH_AS_0301 TaxID=3041780 RepID=UPI0027D8E778|nr:hypothetical protein [Rhodococcus sp. SORGH_AS_0301]